MKVQWRVTSNVEGVERAALALDAVGSTSFDKKEYRMFKATPWKSEVPPHGSGERIASSSERKRGPRRFALNCKPLNGFTSDMPQGGGRNTSPGFTSPESGVFARATLKRGFTRKISTSPSNFSTLPSFSFVAVSMSGSPMEKI